MPALDAVRVKGLADLNRAIARASKEARVEVKEALRQVAVPIQQDAQRRAVTEISGLRRTNAVSGGEWAHMRIGVTRTLVYVAPQQRGRTSRHNPLRRRPNMAGLLMDKAMEPALQGNSHRVTADVERALDRMADHFNRGA